MDPLRDSEGRELAVGQRVKGYDLTLRREINGLVIALEAGDSEADLTVEWFDLEGAHGKPGQPIHAHLQAAKGPSYLPDHARGPRPNPCTIVDEAPAP